ncbi:MAG TPA: hypothetical protein VNH18_21090 [Bryobacteraceae bacterium]|nr:hypothetical protein [Bryobacteraceae bacterium]
MDQHQIARLLAERVELTQRIDSLQSMLVNVGYPPGHFYSPVVDVSDPRAIEAVRTRTTAPLPAGVALDPQKMLRMMTRLARQHQHFPFPRHQQTGFASTSIICFSGLTTPVFSFPCCWNSGRAV